MAISIQQLLLMLQNPDAAAVQQAQVGPAPTLPSTASSTVGATLGSLIPPATPAPIGPVQRLGPLSGNQGPILDAAPSNVGATLAQAAPPAVAAAPPLGGLSPLGADDEFEEDLPQARPSPPGPIGPEGPTIQDKLKKGISGLAAVKRPDRKIAQPATARPPQGRGTGLPQGSSQVLEALQAGLVAGAQTDLPTLGSLLRGR